MRGNPCPRAPAGAAAKRRGVTVAAVPFELGENTKVPDCRQTIGDSKNGGYLLSQLVGQYHRRG